MTFSAATTIDHSAGPTTVHATRCDQSGFVCPDDRDDCVVYNSCDHWEDEIDRCRCR